MKAIELWMPVVGHEEHYLASSLGRIKVRARRDGRGRKWPEKIIATRVNRKGYVLVNLFNFKARTNDTYQLHRLILAAFTGYPTDRRMTVNHKNGVKTDNRLSNLEWCTQSENILHAYRTGLTSRAKLQPMDVRQIKLLLSEGVRQAVIADMFNVSRSTVAMISCGLSWKWMNANEGVRA